MLNTSIVSVGSYPNSRRNIEPELLRIIQQNHRLDELIISIRSDKLTGALELIKSRPTAGSLAMYDEFDSYELHQFRHIFRSDLDFTITGSEEFPGEMLTPRKDVSLSDEIYNLLVEYYNDAYEWKFATIAGTSDAIFSGSDLDDLITVLPNVTQHGRIRIGSEVFSATITPGIQKIRTYWQSLCRIPKQSIRSLVKFNSFLHIQLNFLLVQEHINWLLSSGTYLHRILEPGFTAKLMMTTMMYVMLNFGGISSTMLIGPRTSLKQLRYSI